MIYVCDERIVARVKLRFGVPFGHFPHRIETVMLLAPINECVQDDSDAANSTSISASDLIELTSIHTAPAKQTEVSSAISTTEIIDPRWVYLSATIAAVSFLLLHICDMNFCDPDMWHEMSLFRQTLIEGRVPTEDRFAYTPTVSPSIHHEWGSGAIFYAVAMSFGACGIMVLKYALVAGVIAGTYRCARQRGASAAVYLAVAPAMALFSSYGFTTIRAQAFTLLLLTIMLCLLEIDRRGRRWWIAVWLPLHVVWLNLHGGFVVGAGLMAVHACEQILRRRPFWHFVPVGVALFALVYINPYGRQYLPYLMHGVTMARPLIVEWNPLWQHDARIFGLFLLSWIPVAYAARRLGMRRLTGILILMATAYAALRHTRHLSLYCVVWTCYVPGYLQQAPVGALIDRIFRQYGRLVTQVSVIATMLCMCRVIAAAPWQLVIPSTNAHAEQGLVCYPVGAVQYLQNADFHGNLMLPFEVGGYAMWKLPRAKVSIDGRYEVAYQPGVLEEHLLLFRAKQGWQDVLIKYPTDAVIVPSLSRLSAAMPTMIGWTRTYHDGVYEIYARPALSLDADMRTCDRIRATMP